MVNESSLVNEDAPAWGLAALGRSGVDAGAVELSGRAGEPPRRKPENALRVEPRALATQIMRALHTTRSIVALGLCAALLATPVLAQTTEATLVGEVTDASNGQLLRGATVILTSPTLQGSRQAKTDEYGRFRISQLPIGTYSVLYVKGGYKRIKYTGIRLKVGQTARLNAKLQPQAQAPAQPETQQPESQPAPGQSRNRSARFDD